MHLLQTLELYPHILLSDFLRYFMTAGSAYLIFWVLFKKKWRHRIIQEKPIQIKKMWFEFRYSMSTVIIFALVGWTLMTAKLSGYTLIYDDIDKFGILWYVLSIAIMIVLHDAFFYWAHRFMHHPYLFRHVHLIHHRSNNPSPWAAYAFHPIEAIIEAAIFPLIVFTIPAHESALFVFLIYMIVRNVQGHLGIEFLPKWFINNKWFNWHTSTTHHDLHHKDFDSNYGLYFTWWDRWFNTEHRKYIATFNEITDRTPNNPLTLSRENRDSKSHG